MLNLSNHSSAPTGKPIGMPNYLGAVMKISSAFLLILLRTLCRFKETANLYWLFLFEWRLADNIQGAMLRNNHSIFNHFVTAPYAVLAIQM